MGITKSDIEKQKQERLGEVNYNFYGSKMTIVKYNSVRDITVQFDDGYSVDAEYKEFKSGIIKNPYDKSVHGIGYFGEGIYKAKINDKMTKQYEKWTDMIRRCYSEKWHKKSPTYKGCSVCDEWLNFQNFGLWFDNNYYHVDTERMEIDKDILIKGNKVYSPDTCIIVPQDINLLFNKHQIKRGKYPIGVNLDSRRKKYVSKYSNGNGYSCYLGYFNTPEEAFYKYKEFKESYIKGVADYYKDKIPEQLYLSMMSWKVEITD